MPELRYNPMLRDWTMVAANRQARPDMPTDACPFCPGSGRVPDHYDVLAYDNDFPVLSLDPGPPAPAPDPLYRSRPAYGKCEVILYTPNHHASFGTLSADQARRVVELWAERYDTLTRDPAVTYILIFENRGREVGATIPHPHGQLYAYPFLPVKIRTEVESSVHHYDVTGRCLVCDIVAAETRGPRVLARRGDFIAFIPYFTDFPYGVWIASSAHKPDLPALSDQERQDLADLLRWVVAGMDALFDREFPYMMVLHPTPPRRPDVAPAYHFHVEFYPPLRAANRIKFLASSETGAGAAANPVLVEETAPQLRSALLRVQSSVIGDNA